MQTGPSATTRGKFKSKGQRPSTMSFSQKVLLQKCSRLFCEDGEINQAALDDMFEFLSNANLNELDFNEVIKKGLCQGGTVLSALALVASCGHAQSLDIVIEKSDVKKLNFKFKCPSSPSIFQGYPLLFLLMHACGYGFTNCLDRIFLEVSPKTLDFKIKCNEGAFEGTDAFWMAALAAARGHVEYLDNILQHVPVKELDVDVFCHRPVRKVIPANALSRGSVLVEALSKILPDLVLSKEEIVEPYSGESTLHLLAQVAALGKPEYLKTILRRTTLTPELLNQKILEGPNKGATLFHLIVEAEARTAKPQGILEEIPNKVLLQLDLNSVVEGGESEGTTALYWLAAAAGNGKPNCLERIISKKPLAELNFRVRGKGRDCKDLTILDWLTRALWFGHPKALERLMGKKAFPLADFKVKNGWGVTPLFYLARGAGAGHSKIFEDVFNALALDESDINAKYVDLNGKGTTLLWWLAFLAIHGKPQYLEQLLAKVPLDQWDLEATCETDVNEGWSVLHFIAEAGNRGHSKVLAKTLSELPVNKFNLMQKIASGRNKGLTVFHQICQAANRTDREFLDIVLGRQDLLLEADFNCRCEAGPHQGTTPLWWACASAIKESSEQLEKILTEVPLDKLDFNATCTEGPNKGISAFQLVVRAAAHGNIKPLEILFKKLNLNEIQFNTLCKRGEFRGTTTLWWIGLLAASGHPEFLDKLLEEVPLDQLDFSLPCLEGVDEGIAPIWWVILAASNGKGNKKSLDLILQNVPIHTLIRSQIQSKNNNIFFLLARCGFADILESCFNEISITELDLNTKATNGQFKGTSLLWWLACLAVVGHPNCFERVLAEVPLDLLNFEVRSVESGKSLKEAISGTRFASYVELLCCLPSIKSAMKRHEDISQLVDGLDAVAAKADAQGNDAYYVLARFFQSCQNQEQFKKYARKISKAHLYYNEIILELEAIEQEFKVTADNETLPMALDSAAELEDLSSLLGKLLVTDPMEPITAAASTELTGAIEGTSATLTFSNPLSHLLPSSFVIEVEQDDVPRKGEFRTKEAQELHSLVMRACKAKNVSSLTQILKKLDKCLVHCADDALAEHSINGFSHLDDVLHLPFEIQSDPLFAEHISKTLFTKLSSAMQTRLSKDKFAEVMSNSTNKGFVLLQDALRSGSVTNTQMVIELSESSLEQKSWQAILRGANHFGYNGFQQAVSSGNLELVKSFITAVRNAYGDESEALLRELGNESWRLFNTKAWKNSQEQKAIKALIDPFVNFKRSSQRVFC